IEAQIYEVWVTAIAFPSISKAPIRKQELLRKAIKYFPGIRSADRAGRKRIGLKVLNQAMTDPGLEMRFKREVVLARNQRLKSIVERRTMASTTIRIFKGSCRAGKASRG